MGQAEAYALLLQRHREMWQAYGAASVSPTLDEADKENALDADWKRQHYFDVGRDAVRLVMNALLLAGRHSASRILDFPSGSGRVTRHLRAMFPAATIGACDLYPSHIDFCARTFGAVPLLSQEDPDRLDLGTWDVIFCGSLLTHLPEPLFHATLRFLRRSLSDGGIALITLEGRHALEVQDHKWKFVPDACFAAARQGFHESGFGYVDYQSDFRARLFDRQARYGLALVKPSWLMRTLETEADIRILSFSERDWDNHQDVVAILKRAIDA